MALRRAIHQNAADSAARQAGEQLCYFVDTNIVRWYLNPLEKFWLVVGLMKPDEPDNFDVVEFASNVIAAHFVFSPLLIGSGGFAPFLTPFHADELNESLDKDDAVFKRHAEEITITDKLRLLADDLMRALDAFRREHSIKALSVLFDAFSAVLKSAYGSIAFREARTRRLFAEDRVVRASEYGDFNLDQSYLQSPRTQMWRDLLVECGKSEKESKKLDRDASSLRLLEHLNFEAVEKNRSIRFLMISTDSSLHEAVNKWRTREQLLNVEKFDFLRHPREYVPIINLNSMRAHADRTIEGFSELMQTVEDISFSIDQEGASPLSPDVTTSLHFPESFSNFIRRDRGRNEKLLNLAPKVDELSGRWKHALETSVLMNAELVAGIADDYVANRIKPLADGELDDVLRKQILIDIHQIASTHIDFAARGQLMAQLKAIRRLKQQPSAAQSFARPARSPSLVRLAVPQALIRMAKFVDEEVPGDLPAYLTKFVFSKSAELLDEFEQAVRRVSSLEAAAVACLIAFRLSQWEQARYLADRLLRAYDSNADRIEYEYLRVVADRFSGLSLDDFQRNRTLLQERIRLCREDRDDYGVIRSLAEAGAQCLFYGYWQALIVAPTRPIADSYVWATIYDAEGYLTRAHYVLAKASRSTARAEHSLFKLLRTHILANLLSVYFFIELRPIPLHDGTRRRESQPPPHNFVDELYNLTGSNEPTFRLAEFYALCARKRLGGDRWGASDRVRMRVIMSAFSRERKHFEEIDRREVDWLCNVLNLLGDARAVASDTNPAR